MKNILFFESFNRFSNKIDIFNHCHPTTKLVEPEIGPHTEDGKSGKITTPRPRAERSASRGGRAGAASRPQPRRTSEKPPAGQSGLSARRKIAARGPATLEAFNWPSLLAKQTGERTGPLWAAAAAAGICGIAGPARALRGGSSRGDFEDVRARLYASGIRKSMGRGQAARVRPVPG